MNTDMKKQTAVEWLIEQIFLNRKYITYEESIVFEKAKAMEKEQMRLIYEGLLQNVGTSIKESDLPTFEQYYNETYGGDK
jgi:hypothetical protein